MKKKAMPAAKARTGTRSQAATKKAAKVSARKGGVSQKKTRRLGDLEKRRGANRLKPGLRAKKEAKVPGPEVVLENGQWETFAQKMALGAFSNTSCYMQAYPDASAETARRAASALMTNHVIRGRIAWLREESVQNVKIRIEEQLRWYLTVKDTPAGYVDAESPLCQEVNYDGETGAVSKIKMPDKMAAAKQIDKLMGFEKPQEVNVNLPYEPPNKALERLLGRGVDVAAILAKAGITHNKPKQ